MPGSCWSEPSRILRSSSSAGSAETRSAARRKARTRYVGSCASSRRNAIRRRAVTAGASRGTDDVYLIVADQCALLPDRVAVMRVSADQLGSPIGEPVELSGSSLVDHRLGRY